MSEPIDIKTKKTIHSPTKNNFLKSRVLEQLEFNILTHWDTWGKFQQSWTSRAYLTFKDLDIKDEHIKRGITKSYLFFLIG